MPRPQELRFYRSVAIMHRGGRADHRIGPSERAPALRVGQEADPYKSGYGLKNGAPGHAQVRVYISRTAVL